MENLNTKTRLLNKVKELEADKRQVELAYENDVLYSEYKKQLQEIDEKRESLRKEMARMRHEHKREVRDETDFFDDEIGYLKSLANQSDGLNPKEYSIDIQDLFKLYYRGYQMPSGLQRLVWVSPNQEYVVFKRRGYGGGGDSWYVEVDYRAYHVETEVAEIDSRYSTDINMGSGGILGWSSTRWSKAKLKEVQEAIKKHILELETKQD